MSTLLAALLIALVVELAVGDPVSRWHPVALFGRCVQHVVDAVPGGSPSRQLLVGGLIVATSVGGVVGVSAVFLGALSAIAPVAGLALGGILLKVSLSYRQLETEALRIADHLERHDLVGARSSLRALVSRETDPLSPSLTASAAIESLGENLSDSLVAPLCYFLIFGVPGALAYRAINTLDAMIGYHGRYEHLGRVAARLDDAASLIPARLTALILALGALVSGASAKRAVSTTLRDHGRTESPNAGWPMAALAGALQVQIEKVGHYQIGDPGHEITPSTIRRAAGVVRGSALIAVGLAGLVAALR